MFIVNIDGIILFRCAKGRYGCHSAISILIQNIRLWYGRGLYMGVYIVLGTWESRDLGLRVDAVMVPKP